MASSGIPRPHDPHVWSVVALGSVVLSIDAELGWGFHDLARPPTDRVEHARSGWRWLVDALERHDVPATWAVVGHLLLHECDGVHALHPAPDGWFRREREEWADRPDLRFGRDLVEAVANSDVDHELASHTFSHVEFGRQETTRDLARAEVETSLALAEEAGFEPSTLIFPRNNVGHRDVLAESKIRGYRGPSPTNDGVRGIAASLAGETHLVTPGVDEHGLVDVPASLFLFGFQGRVRSLVTTVLPDPMTWTATRSVDAAAESDGVCHLWLHPNNLVTEADRERMDRILAHVAERRDRGDIAVETMDEVATRVLGEEPESAEGAVASRTRS